MKRISLRVTPARTERESDQVKSPTRNKPYATRTNLPETLDLNSVKRNNDPPVRTKPRIFGLTEAPIYHPTPEQFKDPLQYIESIRPEAEQYGIIKIVPPASYKPPFSLNTEKFRFRTRIQKLNSMEGGTRANVNYLEQVQKFHRLFGHPISRIPQLDKRPIDLYNLKKEVEKYGGYQIVNEKKKWAEIGRGMGYNRRECTSLSNGLKSAYSRIVLPYEDWLEKTKAKIILSDNANHDVNDSADSDQLACAVCHSSERKDELLECDDCERGYHMSCLDPPLKTAPKDEWYCYKCLIASGNDYGFEDGGEYSLSEFQKVCEDFKVKWFTDETRTVKHATDVSEEDCENEFWRLVDDPHVECEVEYGADLHSTQHGSAFPSMERDNKYVDPWNLNMIPILPQSLFTHIKSDISGMMVPWLYVGMCFSAFCWHNEDHYTYSINYMHWGETKTWYGIPGDDTGKFEQTMRDAVPELFEQQPNLLFQLVTMLSPGRLLKEKVRVFAVDQRPGEFVVTFPKAYHSGFNHGFNFCEAVNFAPPDWVDLGLECAKRYKEYKRHPCFSHDELLVNTFKMELTNDNARWLKPALEEMCAREMNARASTREKHPALLQACHEDDVEYQCDFCHCYTHLSHVSCSCAEKVVVCLDHVEELCGCPVESKRLMLRYSDQDLDDMVTQVKAADKAQENWAMAMHQCLSVNYNALIAMIHELIANCTISNNDGIKLQHDLHEAITTMESPTSPPKASAPNNFLSTWYTDLTALLAKGNKWKVEDHHGYLALADALVKPVRDFEDAVDASLARPVYTLTEWQDLKQRSWAFSSAVRDRVPNVHPHADFYVQTNKALKPPLEQNAIDECVAHAKKIGMCDVNEPLYDNLVAKQKAGRNWVKQATLFLAPNPNVEPAPHVHITLDEIDEILNVDQDVPTQQALYEQLRDMRSRAADFQRDYQRTMMQCQQQQLLHRPTLDDIRTLQDAARHLPASLVGDQTKIMAKHADTLCSWSLILSRILSGPNHKLKPDIKACLATMRKEVNDFMKHRRSRPPFSTASTSANTPKDHYCICLQPESGWMVNCDSCQEWYHGSCVKLSSRKFDANTSYVCPVCKPEQHASLFDYYHSHRPSWVDICHHMDEANNFLFVPELYADVKDILLSLTPYRDQLWTFCRSKPKLEADDLPAAKVYLRELIGLPIYMQFEIDFLVQKINELSAISQTLSQPSPPTSVHELTNTSNAAAAAPLPPLLSNGSSSSSSASSHDPASQPTPSFPSSSSAGFSLSSIMNPVPVADPPTAAPAPSSEYSVTPMKRPPLDLGNHPPASRIKPNHPLPSNASFPNPPLPSSST